MPNELTQFTALVNAFAKRINAANATAQAVTTPIGRVAIALAVAAQLATATGVSEALFTAMATQAMKNIKVKHAK